MNSTLLLIMRHAKSDWNTGHQTDFERILSDRGNKDAPRMGQWIVDQNYTPDHVICSPAQRVKETISLVANSWELKQEKIQWEDSIYNANLSQLLAIIAVDLKPDKINLLVGHNPGVNELILYLSGNKIPDQATGNLMPTAAITVLKLSDMDHSAQSGAWQIVNYMKPKLLP
ncbi:MAG: histidine phosphatase family protein [Gammaproteobacteria bacterium]